MGRADHGAGEDTVGGRDDGVAVVEVPVQRTGEQHVGQPAEQQSDHRMEDQSGVGLSAVTAAGNTSRTSA